MITRGRIEHLVEAAVGAGQQAGIDAAAKLTELFRLAFKKDGPGRTTRAPEYGLWAFDDGQAVVGFRGNIGSGCVHSVGAGAEHGAAVGEDVQARAKHAAQHRVAIGAASTYGREARDGFQVVGAVAGRHRLAWFFRVGDHGQGRAWGDGCDHRGAQFGQFVNVLVGSLYC
ncbi:hypothetical protein D3C76_1322460 [compost metagenome]